MTGARKARILDSLRLASEGKDAATAYLASSVLSDFVAESGRRSEPVRRR